MTGLLGLFWDSVNNRTKLDDLNPKYIVPYLVSKNVISNDEEQAMQKTSSEDVTGELMKLLSEKESSSTFAFLLEALRHENAYPWIAKQLEQWKLQKNQHDEVLMRGVVPFPLRHDVGRKPVVDKIREALYEASETGRSWVVIQGMLGIGKTMLASKALRDPQLSRCFPGGIFWIAVGKTYDDNQLLLKMQLLWEHFDKHYRPATLDSCHRHLRQVASAKKRALLVLDDVWYTKVLHVFDLGWTVLVTTRDESVANGFDPHRIYVDSGFTLDESMKFFASVLRCAENELPDDAKCLHEKYKGNPFVISLFGSKMSKYGNDKSRWERLRAVGVKSEFKGRTRKASAHTLDLLEVVELNLEDLDEDIKTYYQHFALFSDDLYINRKVFEVLWDVDNLEAEDILEDLVQKSLLLRVKEKTTKRTNSSNEFSQETNSYGIHDILLDYLKDHVSMEKLEEMHRKLVTNYLQLCAIGNGRYDFRRFPDDDYIHTFLAHHVYKSKMFDLFPTIFLDLQFVECKLQYAGPADLIHDYSNYGSYFGQAEEERMDFERFIRQKAHLLNNNYQGSNLYQLALQEPSTSSVYKKALLLVQSDPSPDKHYFRWCNASQSHDVTVLSAKPHDEGAVNHIVFSPDNKFLVSVGDDRVVRLLETHSSRVFQDYFGHEGPINQCCITSSGDVIATASSDKTVRLWTVLLGGLKTKESTNGPTTPRPRSGSFPFPSANPSNSCLVFDKHHYSVLTCFFANCKKLVVSGDSSGVILVWKSENGDIMHKLDQHSDEISCCRFSADDKYIATSSRDSIVFVWCVKTGKCLYKFSHSDYPAVYCQFMRNSSIISAAGQLIKKWRLTNGMTIPVRSYNSLKTPYTITCCALSPDELFVAGGTSLKYVVVWATRSGDVQATLKGHCDVVVCVNYSNDSNMLVSSSVDGAIFIWDMKQASKVSIVSLTKEMSVQFQGVRPHIAVLNEVNSIQLFKGPEGKSKDCFDDEKDEITACCLSVDCEFILFGTKSGALKLYSIMNKTVSKEVKKYDHAIEGCLLTASGKIVTTFINGNIEVLDADKLSFALQGHTEEITQYKVYDNDRRLLSCSKDGKSVVWDLENYRDLIALVHGEDTVTSCDVSKCTKFIASASVDKTVKVWSAERGDLLFSKSCNDHLRKCCFSHCGTFLAIGTDGGEIQVIEWEERRSFAQFGAHVDEGWVNDLQFSPDSRYLVSVSNTIKWWKTSGQLLRTFIVKGDQIKKIFVCSKFKVFVTVDSMGVLYILERIQ